MSLVQSRSVANQGLLVNFLIMTGPLQRLCDDPWHEYRMGQRTKGGPDWAETLYKCAMRLSARLH